MTKSNVLNFGVGNYGLDQAILRLKREYPRNKTKIVIMGVVPSTIVRILSVWKHYNEFGNIFGFKPRYIIEDGRLKCIQNIIDSEYKLERYRDYLPDINRYDSFYETKFCKEMIKFPYLVSILSDPFRNLPILARLAHRKSTLANESEVYPPEMKTIMKINFKLRRKLFLKNVQAVQLLESLALEFERLGGEMGFTLIFLWMPQKDDVLYLKKGCGNYYQHFVEKISGALRVLDLTPVLLKRPDIDDLYCDKSEYGGHFSSKGNIVVADCIYQTLKEKNSINYPAASSGVSLKALNAPRAGE